MTHTKPESEFCTIQYAARRSGLALKTWYEGGAGTDIVPRIRFGRSIRLVREDVEQFIQKRIEEAQKRVSDGGKRRSFSPAAD